MGSQAGKGANPLPVFAFQTRGASAALRDHLNNINLILNYRSSY
jgi:hypothetical protein